MLRKYLTLAADLDPSSIEKLITLKNTVEEAEKQSETGSFAIRIGSFGRFRKRSLQKKMEMQAESLYCFELTLNEWKAVSENEIRLYPNKDNGLLVVQDLICPKGRGDREPPYVRLLSGSAEQIKGVSEKLKESFQPVTVTVCALELKKTVTGERLIRKVLQPDPEKIITSRQTSEKDLSEILLKELQPSQFYVSEEKLRKAEQWFNPEDLSNFEPISVKELDGKLVMLDGHTRAVAALNAGLEKVPLIWETEEWDWEMYRRCVHECEQRDVLSPLDLVPRVISAAEYWEKWDAWCDRMQAEVDAARKS